MSLVLADTAEVTITFPSSWKVTLPGQGEPTRAADGTGRSVLRATTSSAITITRTLPAASWIRMGGPFVAAGGVMPPTEDTSTKLALRAGYETAHRGWLIYSLAVDTDLSRVTLAPVVEAALPTSWRQHWAVGVGIPIEVAQEREVGVRGQISLHVPLVGMVITVDHFPGRDESVAAVYGQLQL
jgi:hypothetical protein